MTGLDSRFGTAFVSTYKMLNFFNIVGPSGIAVGK